MQRCPVTCVNEPPMFKKRRGGWGDFSKDICNSCSLRLIVVNDDNLIFILIIIMNSYHTRSSHDLQTNLIDF